MQSLGLRVSHIAYRISHFHCHFHFHFHRRAGMGPCPFINYIFMRDNSIRKVALPLEFISKEAIPRQFLGLNHFQGAVLGYRISARFLFLFFVNSIPFFSIYGPICVSVVFFFFFLFSMHVNGEKFRFSIFDFHYVVLRPKLTE